MSTALAEIYEQSAADWLDQFNRAMSRAADETDEDCRRWRNEWALMHWCRAQRNLVEAKEQRNV